MKKKIIVFTVTLKGEYLRLYNELLGSNSSEIVQQKLVEAGFHKLTELKKQGVL